MEYGFFHPDRGYWQATSKPSAETLAGYPDGTVSVPLKPGADYEWQGGRWFQVLPDAAEALAAEREAAIQEAVQDMEAERLATFRAQAETELAGAKTVKEIQQLRDLRSARSKARPGR
tara:strand:- start:10 stop:363 length:354 start_codon:yes stop_codon:yes gene_type:complete